MSVIIILYQDLKSNYFFILLLLLQLNIETLKSHMGRYSGYFELILKSRIILLYIQCK